MYPIISKKALYHKLKFENIWYDKVHVTFHRTRVEKNIAAIL